MLKRKNGVIKIALTVFVLGICTIFGKNLSRLSWAYEVPIENIDVRDTKTGEWVWDGKYQKWWYKYSDGTFPASEWEIVYGKWYHFDKNGWMETKKWIKSGSKWYYLNDSGAAERGWLTLSGKTFHFSQSGAMETGWQKIDGKWYYFNSDGFMQIGWQKIENKWYYLGEYGVMQTDWRWVDGYWFYLDENGVMQTDWIQLSGVWYYLNEYGVMQTGWKKIKDTDYYFDTKGVYNPTVYRALVLGETSTPAIPILDVNYMYSMFNDYKSRGMNFANITRYPDQTIENIFYEMDQIFSSSDESDINYIYMSCHGGPDGGIQIGKNEGKVYGATLRNKLSRYKGKFVIMLDCCHAGVIIGRDADGQEENVTNTQVLDNFVNSFKEDNMPRAGELAEPKYMVLASCSGRQKSYTISGNGEATGAWLNGAGWNTSTALSDVQRADKNGNKKITLQELYSYSRDAVWASVGDDPEKGQEVVVYPSNCDFNIFVR